MGAKGRLRQSPTVGFAQHAAFHNDNTRLANVITLTIALDVVTDCSIGGHADICVHGSPADSGATSDVTAVKKDGVLGLVQNKVTVFAERLDRQG
jgi:hypothetical protein